MRSLALAIPLASIALAGCAQVGVDCGPRALAHYRGGFIVPSSQPIEVVDPDGKPKLEYTSDYRHACVVRETGLFGSADFKPTFNANGTLAGIDASTDATSPLSALLGATAGAASAGKGMFAAPLPFGAPRQAKPAVRAGLYRLDLRSDPPRLVGPIAVTPE